MPSLLIIGTQWGDEGKGKIVDFLAPAFEIIARYQGGHNAGHTVYLAGRKIVLHLIPSGILHPGKICLIGNGLVVSPQAFFQEIESLKALGIEVNPARLLVSRAAQVIMPYHPLLEKIAEESRGRKKIGTTLRGIGPCYEDKAARWGIRVADLLEPEILREKIRDNLILKNKVFEAFGYPPFKVEQIFEEYRGLGEKMAPYVADISVYINEQIRAGKSVLFEGAQGALLDLDHGTYPFVTSSSCTAGGVSTGLGVSPKAVKAVLGITKAYTTRVGSGPFPSELQNEIGNMIARRGDEFGATTGRPRRCGWFDAVAVRYACRINGVDLIALTKPDVLEGLPEIKACYAYRYKGTLIKEFPSDPWILEKVECEYRSFPLWSETIHGLKDFSLLPASFIDYYKWLEDTLELKIGLISTGVDRQDIIYDQEGIKKILGDKARSLA